MKIVILILGALVATALADHKDEPKMPEMPDLNQLNNMLGGGAMPQIPAGMKLEDLKDAFYNMPPEMKSKLNEMAESMGVKYDDIEDALNHPPKKLQEMFENGGLNAAANGMFNVPNPDASSQGGEQPQGGAGPNLADMLGNIDMGSVADMMKNVDVNSLLENVDLGPMGNMLKGVDVQGMLKNIDPSMITRMMKNIDPAMISGMMKSMDLGAMGDLVKNVDVEGLMKNMDLGAMGDMMKNVDIQGMMKDMDLGPMGNMLKGMDLNAVSGMMKNIDPKMISGMMKNMDLGAMGNMLKNVDLKSLSGLMKGKIPSLDTIKSMVGLPEDAGFKDIGPLVRSRMEAMGIPTDNPLEALAKISEKIQQLPLPEGMDPSPYLNQLHGQLEAMGMPEDPSEIQGFIMKQLGVPEGVKSIKDLKNPEVIAQMMQRHAMKMMGLDENEDPSVVKDRIVDQLIEEAEKMGAKLPKDGTREELIESMDKMLSKKLNEIVGLDTESIMPNKLMAAAKAKLDKLGLNDFGSLKKHVIDMAMKQMMKKVQSMVMNMMMPKKQHEGQEMPHRMPHHMPHMMPPMMMQPRYPMMVPQPIDLDLAIEVNIEGPPQAMQYPAYLNGVEHAVHQPQVEFMGDEELFHHIMAVREGLRSGEMEEEVLQEMIEDLMQARLRARVLSVRNMFLNDRLVAMEQELQMMQQAPPKQASPAPRSQLMQMLMKPRVV